MQSISEPKPLFHVVRKNDDRVMLYSAELKKRSQSNKYKLARVVHYPCSLQNMRVPLDPNMSEHDLMKPRCKKNGNHYDLWLELFPSEKIRLRIHNDQVRPYKLLDIGHGLHEYLLKHVEVSDGLIPSLSFMLETTDGRSYKHTVKIDPATLSTVMQRMSEATC